MDTYPSNTERNEANDSQHPDTQKTAASAEETDIDSPSNLIQGSAEGAHILAPIVIDDDTEDGRSQVIAKPSSPAEASRKRDFDMYRRNQHASQASTTSLTDSEARLSFRTISGTTAEAYNTMVKNTNGDGEWTPIGLMCTGDNHATPEIDIGKRR
jgi:hypothetical protein